MCSSQFVYLLYYIRPRERERKRERESERERERERERGERLCEGEGGMWGEWVLMDDHCVSHDLCELAI